MDGGLESRTRPADLDRMSVLVRKRRAQRDWEQEGYGALHRSLGGAEGGDLWRDFRRGDPFPKHTVEALGRPRNYDGTEPQRHAVALFYPHPKQCVLGRAWADDAGNIESSFGWNGQEENPLSLQLLLYHLPASHGFQYSWIKVEQFPETETGLGPSADGWTPLGKGGVAPCLCLTRDGFERLGQLDLRLRTASHGFDEKEATAQGPAIASFLLLAKKPLH